MPAPVSITAPNSPKKRGGKTSYGGSRPSPSGGHTAPARTTPTVTTVSPSGSVVSSGPSSAAATARARASQARVRRIQHAVAMTHKRPSKPITAKLPSPTSKPKTFLGKRTVGTPTLVSLQRSLKKGNLMLTANQKAWTTPQVRQVTQALKNAAPAQIPGLDPEQQHVLHTVIQTGKKMGATKKELLAAAETARVESDFRNLNYGDADSKGWRQERTSIYGDGPTGPTNVKASAKRFFQESVSDTGGTRGAGMTAGELAQTIQGSAFPARYDEHKGEVVPMLSAALKPGVKPKILKKAKNLGLVAKAKPDFKPATVKEFQQKYKGQFVTLKDQPGGRIAASIAPLFDAFAKRFDMELTQGYGPGGPSVSLGHQEFGTSLDVVPRSGNWDGKFAKGLEVLVKEGFEVGYDGSVPGTQTWPDHGRGNHAHIEFVLQSDYKGDPAATKPTARKNLRKDLLAGKLPPVPDVIAAGGNTVTGSTSGFAPVGSVPGAGPTATSAGGTAAKGTHKPTGAEILAKLKKYGVGTTAPTTSTSSATLAELEKRYGAPTV